MRRSFAKYLAVCMSISLVGIIFIQFYLLNKALKTSEEIFSRNISNVLVEVCKKLQEIEANFYRDKFVELFGPYPVVDIDFEPITVDDHTTGEYAGSTHSYAVAKIYTHVSEHHKKTVKLLKRSTFYNQGHDKNEHLKNDHFHSSSQSVSPQSAFAKKAFTLEEYIKYKGNDRPIEKRADAELVRSLINQQFVSLGIDVDYEFAILDANNCPSKVVSNNYKFDSAEPAQYIKPLFLNKETRPTYSLALFFPNKQLAILYSIFSIITLSAVVVFIILVTYAASLVYINRQKKISEVKNDFINNMTHEFKTPIATISLAAEALKNSLVATNPEKLAYYSELIKSENMRMNDQVELVLKMSRLEHNQVEFHFESVDLNQLATKAVERIRLIVEERKGFIIEKYEAQHALIYADPVHFENAILNILDNANKYSLDKPEIYVNTFIQGRFVFLRIQDKGIGMVKKVQKKIFERFFRAEMGNLHNVKGHGLGLSYVKKIIHLHNASLILDSQKGKGSTFTIRIPLNNEL